MAKVQLLVSRAGSLGLQHIGDIITVSDAEAGRLVEAHQAILIDESTPETKPTRKRKRK